MYEEYDEYKNALMRIFNDACHAIADNFVTDIRNRGHGETAEFEIGLLININDWWVLDGKKGNFFTTYIESLALEKKLNPKKYKAILDAKVIAFRENYPNLSKHFEVMDKHDEWSEEIKIARFLPHVTNYAYPDFSALDGMQRLNALCKQIGNVGLEVVLDVNDNAETLFSDDAYQLVCVFTANDGESLLTKLDRSPIRSTQRRRLN